MACSVMAPLVLTSPSPNNPLSSTNADARAIPKRIPDGIIQLADFLVIAVPRSMRLKRKKTTYIE
jgi:hypothetical protein